MVSPIFFNLLVCQPAYLFAILLSNRSLFFSNFCIKLEDSHSDKVTQPRIWAEMYLKRVNFRSGENIVVLVQKPLNQLEFGRILKMFPILTQHYVKIDLTYDVAI